MNCKISFAVLFLCASSEALRITQKDSPLDGDKSEYEDALAYANIIMSLWYYNWGKMESAGFTKLYNYEDPDLSSVALFKEKKSDGCVLAFSGFRDAADDTIQGLEGFLAGTKPMCGYQMNAWTADNVKKITSRPEFLQINDHLASGQCSQVTFIGHSVGGALSNFIATCANNGMLGEVMGKESSFKVDKMYTFGAWAPAGSPMENHNSETGCFDGIRFYTSSGEGKDKKYDFMSTVGQSKHLFHPKMRTIGLLKQADGHEEYACDDKNGPIAPAIGLQGNPLDMIFNGEKVLHDLHRMQVYIPALKKLTQ